MGSMNGHAFFWVSIEFELRRPHDTSPRDAGKDREEPEPPRAEVHARAAPMLPAAGCLCEPTAHPMHVTGCQAFNFGIESGPGSLEQAPGTLNPEPLTLSASLAGEISSWPVPRHTIPSRSPGTARLDAASTASLGPRSDGHSNCLAITRTYLIMLIGILSDTHDQVERTRVAVNLLIAEGATALIHCGDLTGPEVVYECSLAPSYFVFGNCDYDREALRQAIATIGGTCLERGGLITLAGRRIAVTHGDSDQELSRLRRFSPTTCSRATLTASPTCRRARPGGSIRGPCIARQPGRSPCWILQAIICACCH